MVVVIIMTNATRMIVTIFMSIMAKTMNMTVGCNFGWLLLTPIGYFPLILMNIECSHQSWLLLIRLGAS